MEQAFRLIQSKNCDTIAMQSLITHKPVTQHFSYTFKSLRMNVTYSAQKNGFFYNGQAAHTDYTRCF